MSFMTKCSVNRFIKNLNLFNTMPRQLCNTEKFYQELGLESLQNRHKLRRLCLFYLFYHTPSYLHNLNPKNFQTSYSLGTTNDISLFRVKHGFFKSFSSHSRIIEQNNLDYHLCNAPSINVFKQNILKFICLGPDKVYNVHNPTGLKLLTRLRLGSVIYELISSVIISVTVLMNYAFAKLILNLRTDSTSNAHYIYPKGKPLLRKSVMLRFRFLIKMKVTCYTLLFGCDNLSDFKNVWILSASTEYILSIERFNAPL